MDNKHSPPSCLTPNRPTLSNQSTKRHLCKTHSVQTKTTTNSKPQPFQTSITIKSTTENQYIPLISPKSGYKLLNATNSPFLSLVGTRTARNEWNNSTNTALNVPILKFHYKLMFSSTLLLYILLDENQLIIENRCFFALIHQIKQDTACHGLFFCYLSLCLNKT